MLIRLANHRGLKVQIMHLKASTTSRKQYQSSGNLIWNRKSGTPARLLWRHPWQLKYYVMIISSPRNVNHAPTNVNHALLGVSLCPHSLSLCSNDVDVFVQINQLKKEKEKEKASVQCLLRTTEQCLSVVSQSIINHLMMCGRPC